MLFLSRATLAWTLLAVCSLSALAEQQPEVIVPPDTPPFELSVQLKDASFPPLPPGPLGIQQIRPGGSVGLHLTLTWKGTAPITIYEPGYPAPNWLRLTIKTPLETVQETTHNVSPPTPWNARADEIVTLQPGDSVTEYFAVGSVLNNSQNFWFHDPGAYELTAVIETHVAKGDPSQPEAWQSVGSVAAKPVAFIVTPGDAEQRDLRLVSGQVTDADGAPVPRADVYVFVERTNAGGVLIRREFQMYDRAATDENGFYVFPSIPAAEPRLMLGVVHLSHPAGHKVISPDPVTRELEADLRLPRGRGVMGTVVDSEGRPLPGVRIRRPSIEELRLPGGAETDADGRFELQGVPTEEVMLPVSKRDWEVVDQSHSIPAGDEAATIRIVMQPRRPPVQLAGIARFENGEPARNLELALWVDRAEGDPRQVRGKTDGDGRFAIDLTSDLAKAAGPYSGLAITAEKPHSVHELQSRWMSRFTTVDGQGIELVFRREHSLTVHLSSANPLPEALQVQVRVSARPSHGDEWIAEESRSGSRLTPLTVRKLTAGRYLVDVEFLGVSRYRSYQDVEIPFGESTTEHEITVNIPEFQFGSLRVEVQLPDGGRPPDGLSLELYGENMSGFHKIDNGVVKYPAVPVGNVYVQVNERDGFVALPLRGRIEAGKETTLGPLVLQRVAQAYGHVTGKVVMPGGAPALGAAVSLQSIVAPNVGTDWERTQVNGSGEFRVSARPETKFLVVNLKRCDLWPPGSVAETATPNSQFAIPSRNPYEVQHRTRLLVRPVSLAAGQEQTLDLELPDVDFREVTIELAEKQSAHVTLWTELDASWMQLQCHVPEGGSHTFEYVPDRPTRLFVTSWQRPDRHHAQHQGAAVIDVPAGPNPTVGCDLSQVGTLRVRARGTDGGEEFSSCRIRPVDVQLPAPLGTLAGVAGESVDRSLDDAGYVTFRLSPGEYEVNLEKDGNEQTRSIAVRLGETQDIE